MYILKHTIIKPKSFGTIVEQETGNPLSFAIIHIKKGENEVAHKVANKLGKFYALVQNGIYTISIDKKNSDESYTEVYKQDRFEVNNGVINNIFEV